MKATTVIFSYKIINLLIA